MTSLEVTRTVLTAASFQRESGQPGKHGRAEADTEAGPAGLQDVQDVQEGSGEGFPGQPSEAWGWTLRYPHRLPSLGDQRVER